MLKVVCCLLLTVLLHAPLHAQGSAAKRTKIEELFVLTHMESTLSQLLDQQAEQLHRVIPRYLPEAAFHEDERKDVDQFIERTIGMARTSLDWKKLRPQYVDLYDTTYTDDEVDGLLAFYRSPVGQATVTKQTELANRSQALTQLRLSEIQPRAQKALQDFVKQMREKYPASRSN